MTAPPPQSPQPKEDKQEKQDWKIQVADILLKVIATGGLGGAGVLVTTLANSDLPIRALGGLIGVAVGQIGTELVNPSLKKLQGGAKFGGNAIAFSNQ